MTESKRRAKNKYREKVAVLRVELYPTDDDIKSRLSERVAAGEGKATYIKRLIREDMQRKKAENFLAKHFNLPPSIFDKL